MKKYIKRFVLMLTCIIGLSITGYTQAIYEIEDNEAIDVHLQGTSTMHDWEMDATSTSGEAQFIFKSGSSSDLISLKSLTFALEVKDLQSDSNGLNKNAYEALKSDEFKDIHYQLSSSTMSPEKGGYLLKTKGKLTIAGVTQDIEMDVHSVVNDNGTITCQGSYKLNMTDYEVKPPSFMMGMMKTGDAMTLDFAVVYKKSKGA